MLSFLEINQLYPVRSIGNLRGVYQQKIILTHLLLVWGERREYFTLTFFFNLVELYQLGTLKGANISAQPDFAVVSCLHCNGWCLDSKFLISATSIKLSRAFVCNTLGFGIL